MVNIFSYFYLTFYTGSVGSKNLIIPVSVASPLVCLFKISSSLVKKSASVLQQALTNNF